MGFLKIGTPLSWEDVQKVKSLIRLYGILQFVHTYKCNKDRVDENIMFGDEIEYIVICNDENLKESSALLCATDLIDEMMNLESVTYCEYGSHWTPEYSSFTIEGTPSVPFKFDINSSPFVEDSMRIRRIKLNNVLSAIPGVRAITLPCFPNSLLENSLLMAKRIIQETGKRKGDKEKGVGSGGDALEAPGDEHVNQKEAEKGQRGEMVKKVISQGEYKITLNDSSQTYADEGKSTQFVNSDMIAQKNDDSLMQEMCEDEVGSADQADQVDQLNESNQISQPTTPNRPIFINEAKENLLFECDLFKPEQTHQYSNSCLITDMVISPHARYVTLTKNIRKRRGTKVISFNEIYKDENTEKMPRWEHSLDKTDRRLFKKIKKKCILDEHLIWNKSMTNKKKIETVGSDFLPSEAQVASPGVVKVSEDPCTEDSLTAPANLMNQVIKNSLFSNLDDEKDYIYVYDRKFIEEYSKKCKNPIKDYVYLDAMFFGMSMCCQQVTMSFPTIDDAKYLYDQLAVIAPLFLALTASTPYLGGFLTETDTRWRVISNSVDCRTEEELAYISKPRYSGISLYISNELPLRKNYHFYNDIDVVLDKNVYDKLVKENVDDFLARHVASLFVRDPIVVFEGSYSEKDIQSIEERVNRFSSSMGVEESFPKDDSLPERDSAAGSASRLDKNPISSVYLSDDFSFLEDYEETVLSSHQHFENFQSTNWNSVRFKPPPILNNHCNGPSSIGWRVEFRTPDIQITDFENASVVTLIMVLSKFILKEKLNLYIPMSMLEENLFRSANRDAIFKEKFYFRRDLTYDTEDNQVEEKTLYDIFFNEHNGIFYLCSKYIDEQFREGQLSHAAKNKINEYIEFVKLRCAGKICTGAAYLRNFILNHPAYEKDSYINSRINYDICKLIADIGKGLIIPQELLGVFVDPYKERIKSDLRQINESQYVKSLAYKFISGEDYTQYLLLSEAIKEGQDYYTGTRRSYCEESMDNNTLEFGKKLYQLSA
ncbi:gamma-glutamylcysteine synthetase, putative [Plasmodium knowlesi strain H]|uniref:glutamate--cysteine ligase n=3 Tax=Plasmodium knowlesi TaxID=5850 RepID=A0A5K1UI07_PLAKH|nr:gamma-glutamylcysteine synthetase, putative [Plasmodium knowlesi strain H]OTN67485.1 putative Gamma-glutamylcysteine synthetase [Plasmodium knowlesi]CAA9987459.1 gamma-glutamylcysteine synthetase, putative [Plasmodium knowlesi strain H]SBO23229.1 gamma-glutamylcysteine synthetase, putative [Plasmodium knowlesi strain H]SBO24070.1 gamma-glutamylcysteine synthetase, putative [Plasmodium knowlesi strain H]VVS76933.1 gamma-glutamylcysteine synthetase, putative [Plasmodium knowlesi strain H]|eukprot:XP_002258460.1 Gamma-glutamylcysteine synthetase, putative [Plasmodium knowlesi strain H]